MSKPRNDAKIEPITSDELIKCYLDHPSEFQEFVKPAISDIPKSPALVKETKRERHDKEYARKEAKKAKNPAKHKKYMRKYMSEYVAKNQDKINARHRAWVAKNRDKINEKRREDYAKNREATLKEKEAARHDASNR